MTPYECAIEDFISNASPEELAEWEAIAAANASEDYYDSEN